jgi:hypothetical protein
MSSCGTLNRRSIWRECPLCARSCCRSPIVCYEVFGGSPARHPINEWRISTPWVAGSNPAGIASVFNAMLQFGAEIRCTDGWQRKPFSFSLSRLVPTSPWYTDGTRQFQFLFSPTRPKKSFSGSVEIALKRIAALIVHGINEGAAMWNIINILYREYCLARLAEMRRFELKY